MDSFSRFLFKTTVYYGAGCNELSGSQVERHGIKKVLIITDHNITNAGLVHPVELSLKDKNIPYYIYDDVKEDADVNVIHQIALRIKETGCDGIIVVGGGSPICAAKGAALEATNEIKDVRELEGVNIAKKRALPIICLPTTAGSGSDVCAGFPVLDYENKRHFGISDEFVVPVVSILDPILLKTCPRWPMTYGAIDALTHAIEALWGNMSTDFTDAMAYEAIGIIFKNIREACLSDNVEARINQHIGSTLGIAAGENGGFGIVHALSGVHFNMKGPHGFKCGIFLPHVIKFNLPVCEQKFAKAAVEIGENSHNRTTREMAELFLQRVKQLLVDLDFPRKLEPSQLTEGQIPDVIKELNRISPPFHLMNLREATDNDIAEICRSSLVDWKID
jgi:alcohol dehydrogenase class IV